MMKRVALLQVSPSNHTKLSNFVPSGLCPFGHKRLYVANFKIFLLKNLLHSLTSY